MQKWRSRCKHHYNTCWNRHHFFAIGNSSMTIAGLAAARLFCSTDSPNFPDNFLAESIGEPVAQISYSISWAMSRLPVCLRHRQAQAGRQPLKRPTPIYGIRTHFLWIYARSVQGSEGVSSGNLCSVIDSGPLCAPFEAHPLSSQVRSTALRVA